MPSTYVRRDGNNRYESNPIEFGKLMVSKQIEDVAIQAARDIERKAIEFAPTSSPEQKGAGDGTRYVDHFEVHPDVVSLNGEPRASAVVINDSDYAPQVEFGIGPGWKGERVQGGNPGTPSRPMGRAGEAVGEYHGGPDGW